MTSRKVIRIVLTAAGAVLAILLLTSGPGTRRPPAHQSFRILAGRLELRAVRDGHGPSVILLHGYGESLTAWRGVFDRLAAHADVVALDLPGFGLSAKPRNGYGTDQLGATVLAAASSLGMDSFVLVGHSLGGAVAVAAALAAPERVRALVLLAPAGAATPSLLPEDPGALSATARALITEYEAQRSRFTSVHDPAWLAEPAADSTYLPADDPAYRGSLSAVLREFDFGYLTRSRAGAWRRPVLIVWGEYDQVLPVWQGESLATFFPSASLIRLPRTLHRPHVERPAETADTILAFVSGLPGDHSH